MKKILYIILVNLLLLSLIELFCYFYICNRDKNLIIGHLKLTNRISSSKYNFHDNFIHYIRYPNLQVLSKEEMIYPVREIVERQEKPIVIFGCSMVEGPGLSEKQTVSYKLADYSNHTVVNRGRSATDISYMYWQLNQREVLDNLPLDTQYVLYFFIEDHLRRLYTVRGWLLDGNIYPKFRLTNNELVEIHRFLPVHYFFSSFVVEEFLMKRNRININKTKKLTTKLFNESYKIIKERLPNAKFIIFVMDNDFDLNFFDNLDENIKIYRLPIYEESQYFLEDNVHPSEKYWDKVIPYIAKSLNL